MSCPFWLSRCFSNGLLGEDDLETAAVPETTTTVLLLHQLASLVALSVRATVGECDVFERMEISQMRQK